MSTTPTTSRIGWAVVCEAFRDEGVAPTGGMPAFCGSPALGAMGGGLRGFSRRGRRSYGGNACLLWEPRPRVDGWWSEMARPSSFQIFGRVSSGVCWWAFMMMRLRWVGASTKRSDVSLGLTTTQCPHFASAPGGTKSCSHPHQSWRPLGWPFGSVGGRPRGWGRCPDSTSASQHGFA